MIPTQQVAWICDSLLVPWDNPVAIILFAEGTTDTYLFLSMPPVKTNELRRCVYQSVAFLCLFCFCY